MADELNRIREELQQLYHQFESGNHFSDLFTVSLALRDTVHYKKRATKVTVATPAEDQALEDMLETLANRLAAEREHAQVTNEELIFLLQHRNTLQPELRDQGIFFVFSSLLGQRIYTQDQIKLVCDYLLQDEVLFDHILEPHNKAVFGRSLAVMLVSVMLVADREYGGILTEKQRNRIFEQMSLYALLEQDGRGYVEAVGWAHAFTHLGNVIAEWNHSFAVRAQKIFLTTMVMVSYSQCPDTFGFGEQQRLAVALSGLAKMTSFYTDYLLHAIEQWNSAVQGDPTSNERKVWVKWYNKIYLWQNLILIPSLPQELRDYLTKGKEAE